MNLGSHLRPILAAMLFVGVGAWTPALGQQVDDQGQPVLPDLAPREVEIRGQLQISFPSLRRQPLVGFNPPPRVPEIPLDRRPLIEPYRDAGASVNRTQLKKPDPPGVASLSGAEPFWAEAELSAGRYFSRLLRGVASRAFGPDRRLDVSVRYEGSDGRDLPGAVEEIKNANDDLSGALAYRVDGDRLRASAEVRGFATSYTLYGLDSSAGGSVTTNPGREGRHGLMRFSIGTGKTTRVDFNLGGSLEGSRYTSELFAGAPIVDPSTERTEQRGSVFGSLSVPLSGASGYVSGSASWAGLDAGGFVGSDVSHSEIGVGLSRRTERLSLSAGPRLLRVGFDAGVGGVTGEDRDAMYLSADVDLRYKSGGALTIIATNKPSVMANSLATLFTTNPYLVTEPAIQPTILSVDAEAGLLFSSGPFQFKTSVKLRQSPNWMYMVASTGSGTSTVAGGFFETGYGEARVTSAGGELAVSLPASVQLSTALYVHDAELTAREVQVPYHPRLSAQVGVSVPFASRRGMLQVTGRFAGERYTDLQEVEQADPFLDLDIYARYDLRRSVGLIARVQNVGIGDDEIWAGYPLSPFVVMAGVRVLW